MLTASYIEQVLEHGENHLLARQPCEAAAVAHSALEGARDNPRALHLAGLAAAMLEDLATAEAYLTQAIELEPQRAGWFADLAAVLFSSGRFDDAEQCALRAVSLDPKCAVAHDLLAEIASGWECYHRARNHLRALTGLRPGDPKVRAWLALTEFAVGDTVEATRLMRELISRGMADRELHSDYVYALLYDPNQTRESLRQAFEEWAAIFCKTRPPHFISSARSRSGRKLRIGYVSGEFAETPSRYFLPPIFQHHDRQHFEIICYYTRSREDACSVLYRELVDHWRNCAPMSDEDLADQIVADEVDVLVDLSGHFRCNRLSVFALRPAPVQVTFPIHPATNGIAQIQYILTDGWVCPTGFESQYTEKVYRLSRGYLIYEPPAEAPPVTELPCDRAGAIVFGLFQRPAKLNTGVWDVVAGILNALPNSKLLVHDGSVELDQPHSPALERLRCELASRGIAPNRLLYRGWLPLASHLELLREADIALDTFPYNGTTTTCECLWMGVPVVTLAGNTHVSRVGYALVNRIGVGDLAAESPQEYLNTAVALAQDRNRLRDLRRSLRDRMRRSVLLDPQPFVREIESAYLTMFEELVKENR